ncbi:MAG: hypothetical protein JSR58_08310 [Verrucomicrobia bacterium]|nr:hypothetical protein [Verrucomicrobiota bacterium]
MKEKYGWQCTAEGLGAPDEKINCVDLSFTIRRRATIQEARALQVLANDRFVEIINSDEGLRPYLCEFPFPIDRAGISLSFCAFFGDSYVDGNMAYVMQVKGKLFYDACDPETGQFVRVLQETYEESKKEVESNFFGNPLIHAAKPHEPIIDAILEKYCREMSRKYDLKCERIGGKLIDGVEEIVARFIYFHPTGLDKARELQVLATEELCKAINDNEQIRPYLAGVPLPLEKLKVAVLFRDRNYYSYSDGTLEGAYREGKEVTYLIDPDDDPHGIIRDPEVFAKESYAQAREKVKNSRAVKKLRLNG